MLALTPQEANDDELDAGPRKGGPGAERLCAVTRAVKPVDELIRFVVGPEGVVPDLKRKLPGRGLWVTADRATLEGRRRAQGVRPRLQARGPRRRRSCWSRPSGCWCVRRSMRSPSRAKPGLVAAGFAKVEAAIDRDAIVGLIHASDASADGVAKLAGALRRRDDADRIAVDQGFHDGPIGFGIGPVKCGTCSPACRACK